MQLGEPAEQAGGRQGPAGWGRALGLPRWGHVAVSVGPLQGGVGAAIQEDLHVLCRRDVRTGQVTLGRASAALCPQTECEDPRKQRL